MDDDYRTLNKANWDERAPAHAASPGYHLEEFRNDPAYLSDVVRFDLPLLGDVAGLRGVHLQCHIGTDTISLARLGARMTGLDFSPAAVAQAQALSDELGAGVDFVEADVYDAAEVLPNGEFDLVFTGIGALCWLPTSAAGPRSSQTLLKPGGRLFIREGHPVLWALADPLPEGRLELAYPYVEREEPLVWDEGGTYVETDVEFQHNRHPGVEPRPRRDRDRPARPGPACSTRSSSTTASRGTRSRGSPRSCPAASTGSRTARGGCRTATRSARRSRDPEPQPDQHRAADRLEAAPHASTGGTTRRRGPRRPPA